MKQRSTTPRSKSIFTKSVLVVVAVLLAVSVPMSVATGVFARDYQAEINAAQQQIDQYQAQVNKLSQQAESLENQLAQLASEKAVIQAKIDLSQKKYDKLKQDIKDNEKKIADNQDALGTTLADMYVDATISPLEMLASSNNIGDYVDRQTYQSSINDQLQEQIAAIKKLKAELEKQKTDVARVLADQTNQRDALAKKEAERQTLMNETKGKESAYRTLTKEAKAKKEAIIQAQREAIARAYSGVGGGNIAPGSLPAYTSWAGSNCFVDNAGWSYYGYSGNGQDPAGYGCNQCVSYTAWKMGQEIGYIPSYWGNANMWPASARAAGFQTGSSPKVGSLGVISAGTYGHIVYVEGINSDGTINISQYNEWLPGKYQQTGSGFGYFSTRTNVSPWTYDTYIYL